MSLLLGKVHILLACGWSCNLEAKAVWIEEIDRLNEMVVSYLDACPLQPLARTISIVSTSKAK